MITNLLLITGPEFDFMHLTLRIWTPTGQVGVTFQRLVTLKSIDTFSIQGPQAEVSQWKTTQGWSLQTLHSSKAVAAGHALPSTHKNTQNQNTKRSMRRSHKIRCFLWKKATWKPQLQNLHQFLQKVHNSLSPLSLYSWPDFQGDTVPQPRPKTKDALCLSWPR